MNNIAKLLIGVGVVGVVATTTYFVTKNIKKTVIVTDEEGNAKVEEESLLDRIKEAATKKAIKILSWAMLNQQKIEAAAAILALIGGVFSLVNSFRDFASGKKMRDTLDDIIDRQGEMARAWNHRVDTVNSKFDDVMAAVNDILANMPKKVVKPKSA